MTSLRARYIQKIALSDEWSAPAQTHVDFTFDLIRASVVIQQAIEKKMEEVAGAARPR